MAPRLEVENVECLRGERRLFSGLSFTLSDGQFLRVRGANGSGKTSLLRIVCGLLTPSAGEVRWDNRGIRSLREDYCRNLVYIGHANGLKDELTAAENLEVAAALAGVPADREAQLAALDAFGVAHCSGLALRHLSQGQRRRVALARLALSAAAPLWILDEPFAALDAQAVAQVERLVAAHVGAGGMVALTTHLEVAFAAAAMVHVDLDQRAGRA
jgi:heme exporter protein A